MAEEILIRKALIFGIIILFLGMSVNISTSYIVKYNPTSILDDNWYFLSSYPNYAPSGLPDFNQRQQYDWTYNERWTFCGPAALANILWWFDSKNANPNGSPGDGEDTCSLVIDYHAPGSPNPGPNSDDHNFNNVNDLQSPNQGNNAGELIERLAWYVNCNNYRNTLIPHMGTNGLGMWWGTKKWIQDVGLQTRYRVQLRFRPSFFEINNRLRNNQGILLPLYFYSPETGEITYRHWVAVAGINSDGYIAISDPFWDIENTHSPVEYNDPSIVSHDIWEVSLETPSLLAKLWLPNYPPDSEKGALVIWIIIISEKG
jgi:hypothetical protein